MKITEAEIDAVKWEFVWLASRGVSNGETLETLGLPVAEVSQAIMDIAEARTYARETWPALRDGLIFGFLLGRMQGMPDPAGDQALDAAERLAREVEVEAHKPTLHREAGNMGTSDGLGA